ncbi:hypothetical protein NA57DRAFT_35915 [Rhizodiscina lignyota]|uniref:Uncharacterized protein n=1 Tax=Rhizodiscina lignyota TaxID=1504668 RepID=A0A9P4IEU3_9PEZI|nr:hypothetical protein NA57DRAFT_35915 [Rhizodiscina lignyota]
MTDLSPPTKAAHHDLEDPGAHELASSDENEHFSDASEGRNPRASGHSHSTSNASNSPVPMTRVERVDTEPRYGEVPNTEAYKQRLADAVPDEVEVVPDGMRSRSTSRLRPEDRPSTPGGTPVPKMVVEKVDPDTPAYGDVPGTEAYEKRKMDALPDEIIKSPETRTTNPWNGEFPLFPLAPVDEECLPTESNRSPSPVELTTAEQTQAKNEWDKADDAEDDAEDEEGFGDDFDDFEEGGGEGGDDDDFGDFDDGFTSAQPAGISNGFAAEPAPPTAPPITKPSFPIPDFRPLDDTEIQDITSSFLPQLFPRTNHDRPTTIDTQKFPPQTTPFLTDRSHSLWSQLVAPPPIQPPNWTRSHIRRMFLVSIGVPLDLDEILPRSTQKKLILPSFDHPGRSPRPSSDDRLNPAQLRLKQRNDSNSSIASTESAAQRRRERKQRGPAPPPDWDRSAATVLGNTTAEALEGMSDKELEGHVERLHDVCRVGREVLRYWEERREEAGREKEAFEGVIENLVKHARSVRK